MIQGNDCALDSAEGQGHGEEASYKAKSRNDTVFAFKEKTILVEKLFSPLIHPRLM